MISFVDKKQRVFWFNCRYNY